jgi:hypothetical protein
VQQSQYIGFSCIHSLRFSANWKSKIVKAFALLAKILLLMVFSSMANTGQVYSYQQRVIICMLPLEHADAEQLADVLAPLYRS